MPGQGQPSALDLELLGRPRRCGLIQDAVKFSVGFSRSHFGRQCSDLQAILGKWGWQKLKTQALGESEKFTMFKSFSDWLISEQLGLTPVGVGVGMAG